MNTELLAKVKDRILSDPESFRMGAYITEIGDHSCGCIAMFTLSEKEGKTLAQLSKEADTTPDGYEPSRAAHFLEITPEQARTLFHLNMWPVDFRLSYRRNKAKSAAHRISYFIATNGVE
jgi:hypothetical protein